MYQYHHNKELCGSWNLVEFTIRQYIENLPNENGNEYDIRNIISDMEELLDQYHQLTDINNTIINEGLL